MYFILDTIINGIVFLVLLVGCSLQVYRDTIDFYILALYPANMLNLFISFNKFLVDSLGFSIYKIMSFAEVVLLLPKKPPPIPSLSLFIMKGVGFLSNVFSASYYSLFLFFSIFHLNEHSVLLELEKINYFQEKTKVTLPPIHP